MLVAPKVQVRLTFKPELQQLWVASTTSTQKSESTELNPQEQRIESTDSPSTAACGHIMFQRAPAYLWATIMQSRYIIFKLCVLLLVAAWSVSRLLHETMAAVHNSFICNCVRAVPYSSISRIDSWPIEGKEEYSIIALGLGAGTTSKYWLYYFPSQYISGIKIRLIGLHALL